MDVEKLKGQAAALCVVHPHLSHIPQALLRILDAFDAMARNGWQLHQGFEWRHDEDVYESPGTAYWQVLAYPDGAAVGHEIARGATPLAALLAATETPDGH